MRYRTECGTRSFSSNSFVNWTVAITLASMHTVGAPGPGNNPSLPEHRQGASDGRRAERASEDTNETKNNVKGEIPCSNI